MEFFLAGDFFKKEIEHEFTSSLFGKPPNARSVKIVLRSVKSQGKTKIFQKSGKSRGILQKVSENLSSCQSQ